MRNFIFVLWATMCVCAGGFAQKADQKTVSAKIIPSNYQDCQAKKIDSLGDQRPVMVRRHVGRATWYRYRGGLYAASTKFKKGSILRVINPANHKHVDVTVNDYGPNCRKRAQRIIDLDRIAFAQIARLSRGVIDIVVIPLKIF